MHLNMSYFTCLLLILLSACETPTPPKIDFESLSEAAQHLPENALASMEMADGLEASLFAAEPTLINPTNIDIDERGRVWVIEALNYRNRFNPDNPYRKEGDRVLILEDTDKDGKADKTTVFYQGEDINSALGIWKMGNKVIISSSPNIFMFTDTDGDDKADDKKVIYHNLKGWDHDHGAHAFVFGPDGRLYFNMGNEGVQLQNEKGETLTDVNGKPIITDGTNFRQGLALRCDVNGNNVEVLAHNFRNNFELAVDAYGSIWQSDNDDDGNKGTRINYVMEYGNYGYTDEMTGAGWRTRRVGMHDEIPKRHWYLNDPGVVPNLIQTYSGSPTGIIFYEGNLLPKRFQHQMIHCEPGHQVVRAYPTQKSGAGYTGEVVEVMKSKDLWFRPSDVCTAPDGSIFVADWYDPGVGGHKMGDAERGRIFRIAPKGQPYAVPEFDLSSPENAVKALGNPNLSIRYLAWNKLHDWGEQAAPALQQLWKGNTPHLRARALWLLARIEGQTATYLQAAIKDKNPDIRITGLRAARQLASNNLGVYLQALQNDAAPEVRREVAVALRHFKDEIVGASIWTALAQQYDGKDRWYLEALGIAADPHAATYFKHWLNVVGEDWNNPVGRDIIWRSRAADALPYLTKMLTDPAIGEKDIKRYIRAFHFHKEGNKNTQLATLLDLPAHPRNIEIGGYALGQIDPTFINQSPKLQQSIKTILPSIEGTPEWLMAVGNLGLKTEQSSLIQMFLSQEDPSFAVEAAQTLLKIDGGATALENAFQQTKGETQKTFIRRLGWLGRGKEAPNILLANLKKTEDLPTQRLMVESLGNTWNGQLLLFDLLEKNHLAENLIPTAALKLMNCWKMDIRKAAPKYLQKANSNNPLPSLNELAEARGDIAAGQLVFTTYCANCHQVNGEGINFGPSLSEIGSKLARSAMYSSIIYPSAGINFGYEGFEIKTKDGTQYNGFIESKTEDEIALRMMGGISKTIQKTDIASQEEMKKSLMLDGLHTVMQQEELVNLVEYLMSLKTINQ